MRQLGLKFLLGEPFSRPQRNARGLTIEQGDYEQSPFKGEWSANGSESRSSLHTSDCSSACFSKASPQEARGHIGRASGN